MKHKLLFAYGRSRVRTRSKDGRTEILRTKKQPVRYINREIIKTLRANVELGKIFENET